MSCWCEKVCYCMCLLTKLKLKQLYIFFTEEEKKAAEAKKPTTTARGRTRGRGRGRTRGGRGGRGSRGGRGGGAGANSSEPVVIDPLVESTNADEAIVLTESEDTESDDARDDSPDYGLGHPYDSDYGFGHDPYESDSDDEDEDDYDGPRWGGYGRCYSCGDRGHWANRCPYR